MRDQDRERVAADRLPGHGEHAEHRGVEGRLQRQHPVDGRERGGERVEDGSHRAQAAALPALVEGAPRARQDQRERGPDREVDQAAQDEEGWVEKGRLVRDRLMRGEEFRARPGIDRIQLEQQRQEHEGQQRQRPRHRLQGAAEHQPPAAPGQMPREQDRQAAERKGDPGDQRDQPCAQQCRQIGQPADDREPDPDQRDDQDRPLQPGKFERVVGHQRCCSCSGCRRFSGRSATVACWPSCRARM